MNLCKRISVAVCCVTLAACGTTGTTASPTAAPSANTITIGTLSISDPWARATASGSQSGMDMEQSATAESDMGGMTIEETATAESDMDGMAAGGMGMGAAYMTITSSGEADTLVGASTDVARTVELHTVTDNNGVMEMREVEGGIEVPANGSVQLRPGSYHVMLIGLNKSLVAGETITLRLQFANAGEQDVAVQVREQ